MTNVQIPPGPLFRGLTMDLIRTSTPGELAAWCRKRRAELGVALEGPTCPTCGGDGVIEGGAKWCPDCTGNGIALPPTCRACDGLGVVRAKDTPTIVTCPTCHGGAARLDGLLDKAGVPRFYQTFTWDSYHALSHPSASQREAVEAAIMLTSDRAFFADLYGRGGLCLSGPAGTRKTGICTPAFRELAVKASRPRFLCWRAWLDEVSATWRIDSPVSTADMIADAAKADVLMIDDFAGAGGPDKREWVAETAWKLLEARQSVAGPLPITTNRTAAEIEATYGEAVASRLAALCAVLEVRGDDERRRVA